MSPQASGPAASTEHESESTSSTESIPECLPRRVGIPTPEPLPDPLLPLGEGAISLGNRLKQGGLMVADHLLPRRQAYQWVSGPRNRLQEKIQSEFRERPPGKLYEVPRRKDLTPEQFYREHVRPGRPVVLEGAASDWPCRTKWSLQHFADKYGDDEVVVTPGSPQMSEAAQRNTATLREVIENKDPEHVKYLRFHPMLSMHPELAADIPVDWFERRRGRPSLYSQTQFFIGTRGTCTGMHNSQMCNLFAMVKGEKEWLLYPPNITAYLDPPTTHSVYRMTRHSTPNFYDAAYAPIDGYFVELHEGDVLWNPAFWWHTVRNLTDTIGVGYRWNDHALSLKMNPWMFALDFMARDPTWFGMYRMCRREAKLVKEGRASAGNAATSIG